MALQSSGAISLSNVAVELGRASNATTSLGESAVRTLAGVASGAIALSNLYGKSNASNTISLSNATVSSYGTDVTAYSQYNLSNAGDITRTISGDTSGTTDIGDWISPKTNMGNYECLATVTSGTLTTGTTDTWLNLGTLRSWRVSRPVSNGTSTAVFTVQIRQVGTTTVLASASITLTVTTEDGGFSVMTL